MTEQKLIELERAGLPAAHFIDRARDYARASTASNTRLAYSQDWGHFSDFCAEHGLAPCPAYPETIAAYAVSMADAGLKVSTISRRMSSIRRAHAAAGEQDPTADPMVCEVLKGIRRECAVSPDQKAAAVTEDVIAMVDQLDRDSLTGKRDAAILLIGFAGGLRRSEIVTPRVEETHFELQGVVLTLPRSKGSQEEAVQISIQRSANARTCPVRALQDWITAAGLKEGPVFRRVRKNGLIGEAALTDRSVANLIKSCASAVGLDPTRYSGHSLRAGMATSAARSGMEERDIQRHGRWVNERMVRRYIREAQRWTHNASAHVGL